MAGTSLGTKFFIVQGEPDTFDDVGYAALTYELVGEVGNIGTFGGTREMPTFTPIDTGVVEPVAGSIDYGSLSGDIAHDATNAGQDVLRSGLDGPNATLKHSVKLEDPTGAILYSTGVVSEFQYNPGSANSIYGGSFAVRLGKKLLPVAAP